MWQWPVTCIHCKIVQCIRSFGITALPLHNVLLHMWTGVYRFGKLLFDVVSKVCRSWRFSNTELWFSGESPTKQMHQTTNLEKTGTQGLVLLKEWWCSSCIFVAMSILDAVWIFRCSVSFLLCSCAGKRVSDQHTNGSSWKWGCVLADLSVTFIKFVYSEPKIWQDLARFCNTWWVLLRFR